MKPCINIEHLLDVIRTTQDDDYAMHLKSDLMDAVYTDSRQGREIMVRLQGVMAERARYQEQKQRAEEDRAMANEQTIRQASAPQMYVNSQIEYGSRDIHQLHH